jgi:glycosyltransferase involved in cell wall biosynthesis
MKNQYIDINFKNKPQKNLISFIIPVYKDLDGLSDTINSINKINKGKYETEIIVGSDGAYRRVKNTCKKNRMKLVEIKPNSGSYFARNRAAEFAKGNYLCFIDADITLPKNWLVEAINKLGKKHYLAGNLKIDQSKVKTLSEKIDAESAFPIQKYIKEYHFGGAGNLLIKRTLIEKVGGFDDRVRSGGDLEFGKRVYENGFELVYMDRPKLTHPPRDFKANIRKIKRLASAIKLLRRLYPDRFKPTPLTKKARYFITLMKSDKLSSSKVNTRAGNFYIIKKRAINSIFLFYKVWCDLFAKPIEVQENTQRKVKFYDFKS